MRRAVLSHPLPVLGLVSHYLTNYLIGHSLLLDQQAFDQKVIQLTDIIGYYHTFR